MLLLLYVFHVKGDSRPPSQSPMRIETYPQISFVCNLWEGFNRRLSERQR